jgi:hypothetical protein
MESAPRSPDLSAVIATVEEAKRQLMTSVPSPRGVPARSLADALIAFEETLRDAMRLLSSHDALADTRNPALAPAIDEALRRAERLRLDAPALDYEGLVTILADLIEPLEAFADLG